MARMETTITIRLDPKIEAFITQEVERLFGEAKEQGEELPDGARCCPVCQGDGVVEWGEEAGIP